MAIVSRIETIEERLKRLDNVMPEGQMVVPSEIGREEVKSEIEPLFVNAKGGVLQYSDIAQKLHLDLKLVSDICEELIQEGKIRIDESSNPISPNHEQ